MKKATCLADDDDDDDDDDNNLPSITGGDDLQLSIE